MAQLKDIVRITRIDKDTDKVMKKKAAEESRSISNYIEIAIKEKNKKPSKSN